MKVLVSHPSLNANVKNLVSGLIKNNLLFNLFTAIAIFPGQIVYQLSSYPKLKDLKRRTLDSSWQAFTKSKSFYEYGRILSSKLKLSFLETHETGIFSIDKIYLQHDKWVASNLSSLKKKGLEGVYAYEDGALASFAKAKKLGLSCIYDLPIGYWKSARLLMQEEFDLNPEWALTITGFNDSAAKLAKKDSELAMADIIFVASSFTKKTLTDYPGVLADIKVIPYGFPDVKRMKTYKPLENRKLKVLFIGGVSQRKGISYLFDAVDGLEEQVELTIVGQKSVANCSVLNIALSKHNWIPTLSHEEVLDCMREHDVFVFPSLFEGFGLVLTEAMSQGMPIITTERTAGPDLIEDGVEGWIVPTASSIAIKETLKKILEKPALLEQMGLEAQTKAASRPWSVYGQEMADALSLIKIDSKVNK